MLDHATSRGMVALESAERAARVLREVPLLFVAAAAFGVLKLPVEATRPLRISLDVYAVLALVTFLFTPMLLAGLYGLAAGALDGTGTGAAYWRGIGDGYVNLLLANLLYATVQHLLLLVFTVLAVLAFVAVAGGGGVLVDAAADPSTIDDAYAATGLLSFAAVTLVSLVYLALRFTVAFFLQLYKPAAALGGRGPVEAFRESVRLVRANVESTLAFVLVRVFVMILLVLPGLVALVTILVVESSLLEQLDEGTAGIVLLAVAVVGFCIGVLELAFLATYRVAFYRALAGG